MNELSLDRIDVNAPTSPVARGIGIRPMHANDFAAVTALWNAAEGVGLDPSDERTRIIAYLERNPGLSQIAFDFGRSVGDNIVGAVLCGSDGRRGDLCHLAVAAAYRRRGIGRRVVQESLARLHDLGILKCNIRVFSTNDEGQAFWNKLGFVLRNDLVIMQRTTD